MTDLEKLEKVFDELGIKYEKETDNSITMFGECIEKFAGIVITIKNSNEAGNPFGITEFSFDLDGKYKFHEASNDYSI